MSTPKRYVSLPVEIDAFQFDGTYENAVAIQSWSNGEAYFDPAGTSVTGMVKSVHVRTLEGTMTAKPTDFIIRGIKGEYYPCDVEVFNRKYKEVQ